MSEVGFASPTLPLEVHPSTRGCAFALLSAARDVVASQAPAALADAVGRLETAIREYDDAMALAPTEMEVAVVLRERLKRANVLATDELAVEFARYGRMDPADFASRMRTRLLLLENWQEAPTGRHMQTPNAAV